MWNLVFVGLDAPLVQQSTGYYCGPATVLSIIKYWNKENLIPGNVNQSSQEKIASRIILGSSPNYYSGLSETKHELNSNAYSVQRQYEKRNRDKIGNTNSLKTYITTSLINYNNPVVLLFDTRLNITDNGNPVNVNYYLNYPKTQRHYICIVGIDPATHEYLVRDCNNTKDTYDLNNNGNTNERLFFGEFVVTADEIFTYQDHPYILAAEYQ